MNTGYRNKVAQSKIITHIDFLENELMWPTVFFYKKISVGWKLV